VGARKFKSARGTGPDAINKEVIKNRINDRKDEHENHPHPFLVANGVNEHPDLEHGDNDDHRTVDPFQNIEDTRQHCAVFYLTGVVQERLNTMTGKIGFRGVPDFSYSGRMSKPTPKPIDPAELVNLARAIVQADRFPYLATIDGDQPRLRPVSPVRTDGFTVYVANLKIYHKTGEIAANPKVELGYLNDQHDQVRITGIAEVLTDRAILQQIWDGNPLLRQYLGSIENPQLIVYRIAPTRVRFMKEWALEYYEVPLS
jgi:general stress protein 26